MAANRYSSASSSGKSEILPPRQQPKLQDDGQDDQQVVAVSAAQKCSHCEKELGRGAAMIIESLNLFFHLACFKCYVCGMTLSDGAQGADVRVRAHKLHCQRCYSNDDAGLQFSEV
jgi:F-box protein 20